MLSDIFNLQEEKMKKKRLNKIIVILLAVLMLAAMLPVSAIAESYSAARDLRILNKAHQEVEKDPRKQLPSLSGCLKAIRALHP